MSVELAEIVVEVPLRLTLVPRGAEIEVDGVAQPAGIAEVKLRWSESLQRHALKIWAALHGVVMLAEQGMFTGEAAHATREDLVEDFVNETKTALAAAIKDARRKAKAGA